MPLSWNEDRLLGVLKSIDPELTKVVIPDKGYQLAIYPACYGQTQNALLNLETSTTFFDSVANDSTKYVPQASTEYCPLVLSIDKHFYGLTPLNRPERKIALE
jgi:hypothetical protein